MLKVITQRKVLAPRKATRRRLLIPISLAAMLGALSIGALSAQAEPAGLSPAGFPDSEYACLFSGLAGDIDRVDGVTPGGVGGVESIVNEDQGNDNEVVSPLADGDNDPFVPLDPLMLNDEDSGTYTFTGGGLDDNDDPNPGDVVCVHTDKDSRINPLGMLFPDMDSPDNGTGVLGPDLNMMGRVEPEINTSGVYINQICGTGIAHNTDDPGTAVVDGPLVDPNPGAIPPANLLDGFVADTVGGDTYNPFELPITDVHYEVQFIGGQGLLLVKNMLNTDGTDVPGLASPPDKVDPGEDGEEGQGAGYVNIDPVGDNDEEGDDDPMTPEIEGDPPQDDIGCVTEDIEEFLVSGSFVVELTENGEYGDTFGDGANEEN